MHVSFLPVPVIYCNVLGWGWEEETVSFTRLFLEGRDHVLLVLVVPVPENGKNIWILEDFLYGLLDPKELLHLFLYTGFQQLGPFYALQPLGGNATAFLWNGQSREDGSKLDPLKCDEPP